MKKYAVFLLSFLMLFTVFSGTAFAQEPTVIEIATADGLMEVLSGTQEGSQDTYNKIYRLTSDITIDTSLLKTTFNKDRIDEETRCFKGILDGNGRTVTIAKNSDGLPAQPLFDCIEGSSANKCFAGVQNLNLVFEGDVSGTTVAATMGYAKLENINVTVNGNIVFAQDDSNQYALATGLFGFGRSSGEINISNITVSAKTIGSKEPVNMCYVLASGIYSESNLAGGSILLNGVNVDAEDICAVSSYKTGKDTYSAVCAAGIASGYYQTNLRLARANVNVKNNIYAEGAEGSTADADAFGLGYDLLAMYECNVIVGGNIEAKGNASPHTGTARLQEDKTVAAAGMGHCVSTKYNDDVFGVYDTGKCSVTVGGDIRSTVTSSGASPVKAFAGGVAFYTNQANTWRDVSVKAKNITADAADSCAAITVGFAYQTIHSGNETQDKYDYENISIKTGDISASAEKDGGAYSFGFMMWGYANFLNCGIEAENIRGNGGETAAAGFAYRFAPNTELWREGDKTGGIKSCSVDVKNITANHMDAQYASECAGLLCETKKMLGGTKGSVSDCTVKIVGKLEAQGTNTYKGLLLINNTVDFTLFNNTVTLLKEQADIMEIDGDRYVRFSGREALGRAAETPEGTSDWEYGNRVIFNGESVNSVFCRFDDGNDEGTLWKIEETTPLFTVTYTDGVESGEIFPDQITENLLHGEPTPVFEGTPERDGYTFAGWTPNFSETVTGSVVYTALWQKNGLPEEPQIRPDEQDGGGSEINPETGAPISGALLLAPLAAVFAKFTFHK